MKNYGAPSTAHRHDYLLFLLSAQKSRPHILAVHNVVQHIGVGTVGDDHVNTGTGGNFGGGQLGEHAAGAKAAVGAAAQLLNFGGNALYPVDQRGFRVGMRVGGVQAVDVGHQHDQIGVVVVGISLNKVEDQIARGRLNAVWTILFSVLMSSVAIWGLVRVLKRILFGLEPYEISALFEQRQAMLQSLREGVMAVDMHGRVTMINHTAREILLLTSGQHSESSSEPLLASLREVSRTGIARQDQEIGCNGRLLLCNMVPVKSQNQVIGAISTFRDKTEISQLMQRIDGMVSYVDALRSHTHEFMNKLHVILGLLHMKRYDKLEEYIIQTAQNYQTDIGAIQRKVKSPVIAGFLLGKINRAKEAGVTLTLAEESQLPDTANEEQVAVLITVLGNLIENALDAMEGQPEGEIGLLLHYQNGWLSGEVSDDGPGIDPERLEAIFTKGYSTKGENRGVGLFLARQQIQNLGGDITVESEPGVFTQFFVHIPWDSERNIA